MWRLESCLQRAFLASPKHLDTTSSNINKVFKPDPVASVKYKVTGRGLGPQELPHKVMDILGVFMLMGVPRGCFRVQRWTSPSCLERCGDASVVLGLRAVIWGPWLCLHCSSGSLCLWLLVLSVPMLGCPSRGIQGIKCMEFCHCEQLGDGQGVHPAARTSELS